jgi:Glycosyltransferase family 87
MADSLAETAAPVTTSTDEHAPAPANPRSFAEILKRALRVLFALAMIAVTFAILTISLTSTGTTAKKDFLCFWAAGRLLIHHSDPYDAAAVFALEKSAGYSEAQPLVMWNTPYSLWLSILAGLITPVKAAALWILLIVASIVASIRMLWNIHGRPPDRLHLLGYLFAPTFACTVFGQMSSFLLFGVVGFLYWHRRRPFMAGLCLSLLVLKPQVLLPFGLVMLVWMVIRRTYWIFLGAGVGMAMAMAVPLWFRPSIWSDYLPIFHGAVADSVIIPTISSLVRIGIGARNAQWVQFLPAILGGIWAIGYFARHKTQWDWNRHGSLLLLVSVFVAPYSWFFDEIVVLPAILAAAYCCAEHDRSLLGFAIPNVAALLLVFSVVHVQTGAYIWTSTAWLGWYLFSTRNIHEQHVLSSEVATS